jgi:hypothetical protein
MFDLTKDTLCINIGARWMQLKQWLASQIRKEGLVCEAGFKAQRMWWQLNGRTFKLMELLSKMRLNIFQFAFGARLYPVSTVTRDQRDDPVALGNAAVHWGFGCYNYYDWRGYHNIPEELYLTPSQITADYSIPQPNLAVLRASKLLHQEGLEAGWSNTRKSFNLIFQLTSVFDAGRTPNFNWLNKVLLDFHMSDWFRFFGVQVHPYFHMESLSSLGYIIPALTGLSDLQLWFRSPNDGWMYSPWSDWNTTSPYICCQCVIIDWIMIFAWPFMVGVPKVVIGGAVKKDQKKKWDALLALSSKERLKAIDYLAEEADIFNTSAALL